MRGEVRVVIVHAGTKRGGHAKTAFMLKIAASEKAEGERERWAYAPDGLCWLGESMEAARQANFIPAGPRGAPISGQYPPSVVP